MRIGREQPLPEDFWAPPKMEDDTPIPGPHKRHFINDIPSAGTGCGPDADVWPVYNAYAEKYDREMLETYNGGMDNLLIFAALFSAVVTAFIVLSLPLLQADPTQTIVDALGVISAQIQSGSSGSGVPIALAPTGADNFSPSSTVLSINALWIMSLFISLSTSVLAMLVKQWLRVYGTNLPSPQKDKAKERQARYDGLTNWQVAGIANSLPVLIHVAVALFLIGLVMYLWDLSHLLRYLVTIFVVLGAIGYLGLAVAPLIWSYCPYNSPVTSALSLLAMLIRPVFLYLRPSIAKLRLWMKLWLKSWSEDEENDEKPPISTGLSEVHADDMVPDAQALTWLVQHSSEIRVAKAVVSACVSWPDEVITNPAYTRFKSIMRSVFVELPHVTVLLKRPDGNDPNRLPWEQFKFLLTEMAISLSAFTWSEPYVHDVRNLDWAWSYPTDQVPKEDHLWYAAVSCYLAGGRDWDRVESITWGTLESLLPSSLEDPSANISLFACIAFFKTISRRSDAWQFSEYKNVALKLLTTSVRLPTEILFVCGLLWNPDWQRDPSSSLMSLSAMADFLQPLLESKTHSDLHIAAMQMLANELKEKVVSSVDMRRCLQALIQWFRSQGYVYPEKELPLLDGELIGRVVPREADLLKQCWEAHRGQDLPIIPEDLLAIRQLCPLDTDDWRKLDLVDINTMRKWLLQIEALCRGGRATGETRVLIMATNLLSSLTDEHIQPFKDEKGPGTPLARAFHAWLRWLTDPPMLELHIQTSIHRLWLFAPLRLAIVHLPEVVHKSGIMEDLMDWHQGGEGRENFWDDSEFMYLWLYYDRVIGFAGRVEEDDNTDSIPISNAERRANFSLHLPWNTFARLNALHLIALFRRRADPNDDPAYPASVDIESGALELAQRDSEPHVEAYQSADRLEVTSADDGASAGPEDQSKEEVEKGDEELRDESRTDDKE